MFCHLHYYRNESAQKDNYRNEYLRIIEHGSRVMVTFITRPLEGDSLSMGMYDVFILKTKVICVFVKKLETY
jgi:hypothetical protein